MRIPAFFAALLLGSSSLLITATADRSEECICPPPLPSKQTSTPTPTLPFTLAAFQSPYPPHSNATGSYGVSGAKLRAYGGELWVWADEVGGGSGLEVRTRGVEGKAKEKGKEKEAVFWVDEEGRAWFDPQTPKQLYLNTRTGALSYLSSSISTSTSSPPSNHQPQFPAGANTLNFLHFGEGTSVTSPLPPGNPPGYVNAGLSKFVWSGGVSEYWALCPRSGKGGEGSGKGIKYQVLKFVGGKEDWGRCLFGIQLVALDYK